MCSSLDHSKHAVKSRALISKTTLDLKIPFILEPGMDAALIVNICILKNNITIVRLFAFETSDALVSHVREHPGILLALNAENFIVGIPTCKTYPNAGSDTQRRGGCRALRKKGYKDAIRLPGSEHSFNLSKNVSSFSFYFIGSTNDVVIQ